MKRLLTLVLPGLLLAGAFTSPVNASNRKPANASEHWRYVSGDVLSYAREAERSNNPMTLGMNVRGLTKAAQKLVKSPAAKKRATNKAKAMCRAVAAPGQSGIERAARVWSNQRSAFVAGIDLSAPISRQHAWELNALLDISAQAYASVLCPGQTDRLSAASDLSDSWVRGAALDAPVTDLPAFVSAHGNSVVSIVCDGVTTSGIVINITPSAEPTNAGMKSGVVTSRYGLDECVEGDFLDRRVTVRAGATEYPGYIWLWEEDKDVVLVYTPAVLPAVRDFYGSLVPRPVAGDTAVLVWGQAGISGRAEAGTVVLSQSDFIFTSNRGPGTHVAGAAVFNSRGDLIGIVDSEAVEGGARTITVLPVTRFCDGPYSTSCYIGWANR